NGSVGDALAAADGEQMAALDIARTVLMKAAAEREPSRRIGAAKDLMAGVGSSGAADREQLSSYLPAMASLLRDVQLVATGAAPGLLGNPDVRSALERLTAAYRRDRGVRAFEAVDRALAALAPPRNAGTKIVADWVVLQL